MITFYHDYIDPICFAVELSLCGLLGHSLDRESLALSARDPRVVRHPFEVRPPPLPVLDPSGPEFRERWLAAGSVRALPGAPGAPPRTLPWTRKAHELVLVAAEHDRAADVHVSILLAHHVESRDIGRVDTLVGIARDCGLPEAAVKVSLDVDRLTGRVAEMRSEAERSGVHGVPTLLDSEGQPVGTSSRELSRALRIDP